MSPSELPSSTPEAGVNGQASSSQDVYRSLGEAGFAPEHPEGSLPPPSSAAAEANGSDNPVKEELKEAPLAPPSAAETYVHAQDAAWADAQAEKAARDAAFAARESGNAQKARDLTNVAEAAGEASQKAREQLSSMIEPLEAKPGFGAAAEQIRSDQMDRAQAVGTAEGQRLQEEYHSGNSRVAEAIKALQAVISEGRELIRPELLDRNRPVVSTLIREGVSTALRAEKEPFAIKESKEPNGVPVVELYFKTAEQPGQNYHAMIVERWNASTNECLSVAPVITHEAVSEMHKSFLSRGPAAEQPNRRLVEAVRHKIIPHELPHVVKGREYSSSSSEYDLALNVLTKGRRLNVERAEHVLAEQRVSHKKPSWLQRLLKR